MTAAVAAVHRKELRRLGLRDVQTGEGKEGKEIAGGESRATDFGTRLDSSTKVRKGAEMEKIGRAHV